ncbi:DUF4956 domain-containing protein [Citricoccus zhacaiensis]|uniref:DUF4956 domain-containing protein n=1 Tax=Citricoccus zhacaiensis TaxID=489142 RepID=A0ABQ2LTX3_9MICC|nr:DUF4956 domain-containing protein [Citricoccus zhacaiensis]GGO42672.1 DUF4956 domain-containing protein [Citricoccus zhacaiensis]
MPSLLYVAADLLAIGVLVLGLYRSRHGRKDLVVSFLGANVGVLAVAAALAGVSTTASLGVGLGLFGVLSIIRLRSTELEQHDVAYFFSSLALGLIAGLGVQPAWLAASLMALPVLVLAVVDHPSFMGGARRQRIVVDRAVTGEQELTDHLRDLLGAVPQRMTVVETDQIRDLTIVDVTYRVPRAGQRPTHRRPDAGPAVPTVPPAPAPAGITPSPVTAATR